MKQSAKETADLIKVNGVGTYQSDVQAQKVRIAGHGRFEGGIRTDCFKSSGSCRVKGHMAAAQMSSIGHGHFNSIIADRIQSTGSFLANESVNAESFLAKGIVTIGDTLTAGEVRIRLLGLTSIQHIVAERTVDIRADRLSILSWLHLGRRRGRCSSLKGRWIEVNHLEAQLIVGEEIRIGAGCTIEEVRYSNNLVIDPDSRVERIVKITTNSGDDRRRR
ncbi:hypothetical protein [Paenibacillus spongiae]|uniref:Bactofilin n=1 Tax=Paenibacillus spongiae TaxID=2909671 RepID=A0ABY5S3E3_9BACL|nr:hypothetical protein [Paenibacillus spongiae]UVI28419.1 hypothetical protein L1F29_23610 [Paenibacillus spongiae]